MAPADGAFNPFKFREAAAPGMDGWFKDAKLGMFMHWGPVSQWGTEISFPLLCSGLVNLTDDHGNLTGQHIHRTPEQTLNRIWA